MTKKLRKIKPLDQPKQQFDDKPRQKLRAKTEGQRDLIRTIAENEITLCMGPAGTGKGHIAMGYAVEYLMSKQVSRIILSRPIVAGGQEEMGHLPGTADEKISPYLRPLLEVMKKFASYAQITEWKNNKSLEFIPLAHTRGVTYDNAVVIFDECQNMNQDQLKMCLTRIGENAKMIILGDVKQSDLHKNQQGAFLDTFNRLKDTMGVGTIKLGRADIVRKPLIGTILDRLGDSD